MNNDGEKVTKIQNMLLFVESETRELRLGKIGYFVNFVILTVQNDYYEGLEWVFVAFVFNLTLKQPNLSPRLGVGMQ